MYVRPNERAVRPLDGGVPPGVMQQARRLVLEAAQAGLGRLQTARAVDECWRELRSDTQEGSARRSR
jgi:hypothetical protein